MMKQLRFYKENNKTPVLDWILTLSDKAQIKCLSRIELLKEKGNKLRRPYADFLRDDIYELRIIHSGNQYRVLYFFDGTEIIVLTHSFLKKTNAVSKKDINKAIKRMDKYLKEPDKFTSYE